MMLGCCNPQDLSKDFKREIELTADGVNIKITAADPKKAEALKNLFTACQTLSGESCCG
jgi:hypothetical protein